MTLTGTRLAAVIFDCDGTLVDSEPLARVAWERSLAPHGYEIDDAEYAGLIGLPYRRVHGFFAERIPGLEAPDAFWELYSGRLFELIDTELVPFADALETVRGLAERGVAVAVASSSPRARLDRTLARAGLARRVRGLGRRRRGRARQAGAGHVPRHGGAAGRRARPLRGDRGLAGGRRGGARGGDDDRRGRAQRGGGAGAARRARRAGAPHAEAVLAAA